MTTEWIRGVAAACMLLTVGIALSCATTSNRHGDSLDTSQYPPDIQDAYKVFAVRCSRCHTLARPLNARIRDPQQWVRYVQRMRLNPASGINAKNGEIILRFLLYYMHQREREHGEEPESELPSSQETADLQPPAADAVIDDSTEKRMPESQSSSTEAN